MVKIEDLIQDVDIIAYRQLELPTQKNPSINVKDIREAVIHDPKVNAQARLNLGDVFMSSPSNVLATKIQRLYKEGHYEEEANIVPLNDLFQKRFPDEKDALIKPGTPWSQLNNDQKIAFGLYLASLGQIQIV